MLYVDVDHFKQVNDAYGHEWGDNLLAQVAKRLRSCIRQTDVAARVGGDEFVLLLHEADVCQGLLVAEKVFASMQEPIPSGTVEMSVSLSIGVADYPESAFSDKELMAHADIALYKAKARGRGQFATFSQEDVIAWRERKLLKKILPVAIENQEMSLRFLPLFDIRTGHCRLVKVSLHWEGPNLILSNEQVFALASDAAVQEALCRWLVQESVLQLRLWQEAVPTLGLILPLSADLMQQRGVKLFLDEINESYGEDLAHLFLAPGTALDAGVARSWGMQPLLPLRDWLHHSAQYKTPNLLGMLGQSACAYCQVGEVIFASAHGKGCHLKLQAIADFGQTLGVTMLCGQRDACLSQDDDGYVISDYRALDSTSETTSAFSDWQDFLARSLALGAVAVQRDNAASTPS